MGFSVLLILSLGGIYITTAEECVPETAKCSKYWRKMLPHKDLIETEDELNSWCSTQALFYKCLEDVLLEDKDGDISYLPTNLLVSKISTKDLCTHDSLTHKGLLRKASCINQLDTDFCFLPEYLDIVTSDGAIPSGRCSQSEKTFSCVAATIVWNCGFDAGRVYRIMSQITRYSDEICGIETSDDILCLDDSKLAERDKKLSEMYYGLFHRIGDVLDQNEDLSELSESVSEGKPLENVDKIITEAIQGAIDDLDKNLVSERCDTVECRESAPDYNSIPCVEDLKDNKSYMSNPIITEVFKGILFYNYSGQEYAIYWRQPEFTVIDNVQCEHLRPSYMRGVIFRCKMESRHKDPDCISNATTHEKVTPEFIRNFDPEVPCDSVVEFGPRPDWMKDKDEAEEERRIRNAEKSKTASSTVTEVPSVFTTSSSLLHIATAMYSTKEPENWFEFDFRAKNLNSMIPNDIHEEIMDLFVPNPKNYIPPPMNKIKVGDTTFFLIYDPELTNGVENMTCSRLDECNPRGRGLWKCKIWKRKIEICDTCGVEPTDSNIVSGVATPRFAKPSDSWSGFTVLETTEPTMVDDGSGLLADSNTSGESMTLIFSRDPEKENTEDHSVDEFDLMNDFDLNKADSMDSEYDIEIKGNLAADPNIDGHKVRFQILPNAMGESSESSEEVYEIDVSDVENESEIIIATDKDGLLSGNILLLKDLSDLNEAKYTIFSTPDTENVI